MSTLRNAVSVQGEKISIVGEESAGGDASKAVADTAEEQHSQSSLVAEGALAEATLVYEPRNNKAVGECKPQETATVGHQDEVQPYPELETNEHLLPPPDFKPFFALIEDAVTGDYLHPNVHYVFADDDLDVITDAALESLAPLQQQKEVESCERFVILDLSADGKVVTSASSLSSDWQVLKTQITAAPSWGGEDRVAADGALMLKVLGREARRGHDEDVKAVRGDIEGLLRVFDGQMSDLDDVVGLATNVLIDEEEVRDTDSA